jgi:hypothetical protein
MTTSTSRVFGKGIIWRTGIVRFRGSPGFKLERYVLDTFVFARVHFSTTFVPPRDEFLCQVNSQGRRRREIDLRRAFHMHLPTIRLRVFRCWWAPTTTAPSWDHSGIAVCSRPREEMVVFSTHLASSFETSSFFEDLVVSAASGTAVVPGSSWST